MSKIFLRSTSAYYNTNYAYTSVQNKDNYERKMHGVWRVITFCLLTAVLPTMLIVLPLYLRNVRYADVMYKISDSDVIQIHKGQSSIFCESHTLKMNTTFNAFQMKGIPELSDRRKHITLKKSMSIPDDTLEYWGFYLFKGATVELKACSRYAGSKILIIKGEKILDTCGILEGNLYKKNPPVVLNQDHVLVTLENPKEKVLNPSQNTKNDTTTNVTIGQYDVHDSNRSVSTEKLNLHNRKWNISENVIKKRRKRSSDSPLHNPNTVLDAGVNHGGNAFTDTDNDKSVSSFETNLHNCYDKNILINEEFPFSMQCSNTAYLEKTTTLKVIHNVTLDGYYYYIFYSDNDIVTNDIHAIFDIYKPTLLYANMSQTKMCVNKSECEFKIEFLSDELVIVEVPTKDGLTNDDADTSILISVCHPRMSVYIVFPIAVLLLILVFAFL